MAVMKLLALVLGVSSLAAAQNSSSNDDYPYTVSPAAVPESTRSNWCISQRASCTQICDGRWNSNMCDPDQLTYQCICTNGPTPNITQYNQTLPFFECGEWKNEQLMATTNATRQEEIQSLKCGGKSPQQALAAYSSSIAAAAASTMMASTTAGGMASSMTGSATAAATTTGGAVALQLGQDYGTSALLTGLVALFGFMI